MAELNAFDYACATLEELTEFSRLESRGTMRIALKEAGLDPASVRAADLSVVAQKVLPHELAARGVADAESICERLRSGLSAIQDSVRTETPEAVFARLGGG
jgi:PleD family two-component response regulator